VKQEEGVELYKALPTGILKRLYMFQDSHANPSAPNWQPLLDRFFERTLEGVANGIANDPPVLTEGRSASEPSTGFRAEQSWPPPNVTSVRYGLGQGQTSFTDMATSTEERSTRMPEAQTDWFFFKGPALTRDRRMTGSAQLDLTLQLDRDHGHLTPILVDVAPDGTTKTVSRGFLNLLYRKGLTRAQAVPENEPFVARVTFKPQDQIFRKGHRIGVLVQASNTIWAVPDDPGATYTVDVSRSSLAVPLLP
jgi:predicted acyl esterase